MKHIRGLFLRPGPEWDDIARDGEKAGKVLGRVLPLCAIPALSTLVGMKLFDTRWDALHGYRVPPERIMAVALANFTFPVLTILVLALVFRWLAVPAGKERVSPAAALKVAAYGAVPMLFAGAFLLLPAMVVVMLVAGIHSLFLYNLGLQKVFGMRAEDTAMVLALSVVLASLAAGSLGALISGLGFL